MDPSVLIAELQQKVTDLENQLKQEKTLTEKLKKELKEERKTQVVLECIHEQEEEAITNRLLQRLERLKQEKLELLSQVESEEEFLTNTLQKKLEDLKREKVELENTWEKEEEFLVNKLQKQLSELAEEKRQLEKRLNETPEREELMLRVTDLENALRNMQEAQQKLFWEKSSFENQVHRLNVEKFVLQQKVLREQQKVTSLTEERSKLEADLEIGIERKYNNRRRSSSSDTNPPSPKKVASPKTSTPKKSNRNRSISPSARKLPFSTAESPGANMMLAAPTSPRLPPIILQDHHSPALMKRELKQGWVRIKKVKETEWVSFWCVLADNEQLHCYLEVDVKQLQHPHTHPHSHSHAHSHSHTLSASHNPTQTPNHASVAPLSSSYSYSTHSAQSSSTTIPVVGSFPITQSHVIINLDTVTKLSLLSSATLTLQPSHSASSLLSPTVSPVVSRNPSLSPSSHPPISISTSSSSPSTSPSSLSSSPPLSPSSQSPSNTSPSFSPTISPSLSPSSSFQNLFPTPTPTLKSQKLSPSSSPASTAPVSPTSTTVSPVTLRLNSSSPGLSRGLPTSTSSPSTSLSGSYHFNFISLAINNGALIYNFVAESNEQTSQWFKLFSEICVCASK